MRLAKLFLVTFTVTITITVTAILNWLTRFDGTRRLDARLYLDQDDDVHIQRQQPRLLNSSFLFGSRLISDLIAAPS